MTWNKYRLMYRGGSFTAQSLLVIAALGGNSALIGCTTNNNSTVTAQSDSGPNPDNSSPDSGTVNQPDAQSNPGDSGPLSFVATPTFSPTPGTFATAQMVTISSATAGAKIYYTTDGTTPNTSSTQYSAPISLSVNTTLKAYAVKEGLSDSAVASATYNIAIPAGTVVSPSFNPAAGTYNNDQHVALTTSTGGATICFTLDGSSPTCDAGACTGGSQTYNAANLVTVNASPRTVKAIACKDGMTESSVVAADYTLKAAAAQSTPAPGNLPFNANVTFTTATLGSTMRYTTDGTDPTCFVGTSMDAPGAALMLSQNTTYKFITCKTGFQDSDVVSFAYNAVVGKPSISPATGAYSNDTAVTITPGAGATITCYTIDGTTPACESDIACAAGSTPHTTPLTITTNLVDTTPANQVQAISCGTSRVNSAVTGPNIISLQASQPVLTPSSSQPLLPAGHTVNLKTATTHAGTKFRYVINNDSTADPNCTDTVASPLVETAAYTGGLAGAGVNIPTTIVPGDRLRAIACTPGFDSSALVDSTYSQAGQADPVTFNPGPTSSNNDVTVQMSTTEANSVICYTLDGSDPLCTVGVATCDSMTNPMTVQYNASVFAQTPRATQNAGSVKARACSASKLAGSITSASYNIKVAQPAASVPAGSAGLDTVVGFTSATVDSLQGMTVRAPVKWRYTISATSGATPPDPTCISPELPLNSGKGINLRPATLPSPLAPMTVTLKVIACKTGVQYASGPVVDYAGSDVTSLTYNIGTVANPLFTTATSGSATSNNDITEVMSSWSGSFNVNDIGTKLCWTSDGTTPGCDTSGVSPLCTSSGSVHSVSSYTGNTLINASGTNLRVVACAKGLGNSDVVHAAYTLAVSEVSFDPTPSMTAYTAPQALNVGLELTGSPPGDTTTTGGILCYTFDGSEPACDFSGNGPCTGVLSGPGFSTAADPVPDFTMTMKVKGCKQNYVSSQKTATYTFTPYARAINVDGVNDFNDSQNKFCSSTTNANSYISFDANNVYIGMAAPQALLTPSATKAVYAYFTGTGSTTLNPVANDPSAGVLAYGYWGSAAGSLPDTSGFSGGNWKYFISWQTDNAPGAVTFRRWNGSVWQTDTFHGSVGVGNDPANPYVELSIPKSDLGGQGALHVMGGLKVGTGGSAYDNAGFPRKTADCNAGNALIQYWGGRFDMARPPADAKTFTFTGGTPTNAWSTYLGE